LFHCTRIKKSKEAYLADCIIKSGNYDKTDLICEIAGANKELIGTSLRKLNGPQIRVIEGTFPFITIPDYHHDERT